MVNIAVVDDEKRYRDMIGEYLNKARTEVTVEYRCSVFDNAFDYLESRNYFDLVFFDIAMPQLSGFEAAKRLRERGDATSIVFLTALAQYAIKGYEVEANDFILKPIKYNDFVYRLKKALARCEKKKRDTVLIKYGGRVKNLAMEDILFIETANHMSVIHATDGVYEVRESLKSMEKRLDGTVFDKCNHSFLINLRKVEKIEGDKVYVAGNEIFFSRNRKKTFLEKYEKMNEI